MSADPLVAAPAPVKLHCLREVRQRQQVTVRTMAHRLGCDIREVRRQDDPTTDLRVSDIHAWQRALDVPISELLDSECNQLGGPPAQRASLIRMMKTVRSLQAAACSRPIAILVQNLENQLLSVMPELQAVASWPLVGGRGLQPGRVVDHTVHVPTTLHDWEDTVGRSPPPAGRGAEV